MIRAFVRSKWSTRPVFVLTCFGLLAAASPSDFGAVSKSVFIAALQDCLEFLDSKDARSLTNEYDDGGAQMRLFARNYNLAGEWFPICLSSGNGPKPQDIDEADFMPVLHPILGGGWSKTDEKTAGLKIGRAHV